MRGVLFGLIVAILLTEFILVAHTPFLSEDWNHLEAVRPITSFFAALDPRIEPLRPFQHAFFWILAHCGVEPSSAGLPFAAHAVAFAMHGVSCVFVFHLAKATGARDLGPWIAAALFAAFPNIKALTWTAAIGNPGRVCFELLALLLLVGQLRAPSRLRGSCAIAAFFLALAWHESALILPAILVAWIVFMHGESPKDGLVRLLRAMRDPWILAFFAAGAAYVLYLFLRPSRYHQAKSFDALPANVVKAATALMPEDMRALIVDGFRAGGGAPFVIAALVFALTALAVLVCAWKRPVARFVIVAVAIELGLPAFGTGFVQRYAYFASALLAIGLALWIVERASCVAWFCLFWLGTLWLRDSFVDASDFRMLGRRIPVWIGDLREQRAKMGEKTAIVILNPIDMYGAERDIPVFNWGLDFMLAAQRVPGPWLLWRTHAYHTSTNVELVDEARVEAARRSGVPMVHGPVLMTDR